MGRDVAFSCGCGTIGGVMHDVSPRNGTHAICHCSSCRSAELFLGQPDPDGGGVALWQSTPDRVAFTRGIDALACLQLKQGNLMRWYASCCNTPLFNTPTSAKFAFASIHVPRLVEPEAIGPATGRGFIPVPGGKPRHEGLPRMVLGIMKRAAIGRLSGAWRRTPFFDVETGMPVVMPKVLSSDQRAALPLSPG